MAKKNPSSAEWHARCLDIVAAISDGARENDFKPGWMLYITVPPYADMGADAAAYNTKVISALKAMFPGLKESAVLESVKDAPATRQFTLSGEGTYKGVEDAVMSGIGNMKMFLGDSADKLASKLEQLRPAMSQETTPGQIADKLAATLGDKLHSIQSLESAVKKAQSDRTDITLLNALISLQEVTSELLMDDKIDDLMRNSIESLTSYKNTVRIRMENWLSKAFAGMAAPYMAPAFKTSTGEPVQFKDSEDFAAKLAGKVLSDEFDKAPKLALEQTGVLNTKVFPVSPYRPHAIAPAVIARGDTAIVKLNWQQARLNWNLVDTLIKRIMQEYPDSVLKDSKKATNATRYPDIYGYETTNNQTITIKLKDSHQAMVVAESLGALINRMYSPSQKPLDGKFAALEKTAEGLRDIADTWTAKKNRDKDIRKELQEQRCITNRIVPYANKAAIFIQVEGGRVPAYLKTAIDEILNKHPEWSLNSPYERADAPYISMHLNSSFTSEAAGLAERYNIANEIADRAAELEPQSVFRVLPPDNGFTVEVSARRINPKDKTDESEGLYVKFPSVFLSGGRLEETSIEDDEFADKLAPICKSFYEFGEEFGKSAANKSMLKLFVPANSQLEAYTKTWMYKLKEGDDKAEKTAKLKELLTERINTLFGGNAVLVNLDWMPDREERKTADINHEIQAFMNNAWKPCQMPAAKTQESAEMEYER